MLSNTSNIVWNKDALSIEDLNISIGGKPLITKSEFKISVGDRIGLLGRNGCGKTTLFNYLSKLKDSNTPWSIFEVVQELPSTDLSITNVVLAAHLERGVLWNRRNELELIEELSDEELDEYNLTCEKLDSMKSDADPPKAKIILRGLGFSANELEKPLNTFSGGWKARVALACGLFMEPDLLLLDEPTNHLDLNAVLWLTEFCKSWKKTLVVITHNGYFAHNVCNSIYHISNKKINSYKCTYNKFLKMKNQEEEKAIKEWEKVEKQVTQLKSSGDVKKKKQGEEILAKKALEGIVRPPKAYKPKFFFETETAYEGTSLLDLTDVSFSYGDKLILKNVDYALYPKARSVLVGANGAGKSTLLKLLIGSIEPSSGESKRKNRLSVKYFNQHFYNDLPHEISPIEYVSSQSSKNQIDVVRKLLGASGLEGEAHSRKIQTLSGGQKARVYFAGLVISQPDILLLDEPTNHLDMETTEGLLNGIKDFPGAVVIVSHDIDFLEELGTDVWLVEDKQVKRLGEGIDGLQIYVDKVMKTIEI
jgi:ATPase subunit of ABC transporter with duplicated ATPase domains